MGGLEGRSTTSSGGQGSREGSRGSSTTRGTSSLSRVDIPQGQDYAPCHPVGAGADCRGPRRRLDPPSGVPPLLSPSPFGEPRHVGTESPTRPHHPSRTSGNRSVRTFLHHGSTNHSFGGGVPFVGHAGPSPTMHGCPVRTVPNFGSRLFFGPLVTGLSVSSTESARPPVASRLRHPPESGARTGNGPGPFP